MIFLFDYNNITDEHKAAAEECAKLIEGSNPSMAALIRERFKIIEPKRMPLEDSEFYKAATTFGIVPSPQGYMVGPDGVQVPMVAICGDLKQLDEFYKTCLAKE